MVVDGEEKEDEDLDHHHFKQAHRHHEEDGINKSCVKRERSSGE